MTKQIPLTRGKFALVDDVDFEYLSQFKWNCLKIGYASRSVMVGGKKKILYMHRVIVDAPSGMEVDHINRNTLDNRRSNLRVCTHAENQSNRNKQINNMTGYKGVHWDKSKKKYVASTKAGFNNMIFIGRFATPIEAARAYDEKARELFGEFARLNFPRDGEQKA